MLDVRQWPAHTVAVAFHAIISHCTIEKKAVGLLLTATSKSEIFQCAESTQSNATTAGLRRIPVELNTKGGIPVLACRYLQSAAPKVQELGGKLLASRFDRRRQMTRMTDGIGGDKGNGGDKARLMSGRYQRRQT